MKRSYVEGHVDVLIPTFNHEQFIEECINSVLIQDYEDVTIHIFDDASTDRTLSIARKIQCIYGSKVKIYSHDSNIGRATSSILKAKPDLRGEFWAYIEGDDRWISKTKISTQVSLLQRDRSLIGVSTNCLMEDKFGNSLGVISPSVNRVNYLDLITKSKVNSYYVHVSSVLWRFSRSGGKHRIPWPKVFTKNESQRSEIFLFHSMLLESRQVVENIPIPMTCYRDTGQGIWSRLSSQEKLKMNNEQDLWLKKFIPLEYRVRAFLVNFKTR